MDHLKLDHLDEVNEVMDQPGFFYDPGRRMYVEAAPCKRCGTMRMGLVQAGDTQWVECGLCGWGAPHSPSVTGAVEQWNQTKYAGPNRRIYSLYPLDLEADQPPTAPWWSRVWAAWRRVLAKLDRLV